MHQNKLSVEYIVFFNKCTCKDALVLEARQEGQGIYTTCQSLCHHFNPRAPGSRLFCACAAEIGWVLPLAELPILIPGTYIWTRYPSQDDASLHSSQLYDESLHPGWDSLKRCACHRPTHNTLPLWCSLHQPGHCCELQVHRNLLDKP